MAFNYTVAGLLTQGCSGYQIMQNQAIENKSTIWYKFGCDHSSGIHDASSTRVTKLPTYHVAFSVRAFWLSLTPAPALVSAMYLSIKLVLSLSDLLISLRCVCSSWLYWQEASSDREDVAKGSDRLRTFVATLYRLWLVSWWLPKEILVLLLLQMGVPGKENSKYFVETVSEVKRRA